MMNENEKEIMEADLYGDEMLEWPLWEYFKATACRFFRKAIPILVVIGFILMCLSLIPGNNIPGLNVQSDRGAIDRFRAEDTTDTNEHTGDDNYDCENFASDTQIRAQRHGLSCAYVRITAWNNASNLHAVIAFRVDNKTIFFEPQNDKQIYPLAEDIFDITWDWVDIQRG